jgi:hypothetical protein
MYHHSDIVFSTICKLIPSALPIIADSLETQQLPVSTVTESRTKETEWHRTIV